MIERISKYFAVVLVILALGQIVPAGDPPHADRVLKTREGRPPVIIVPGLIGSELINRKTGEKVWFSLSRSKGDDIRLPISSNLEKNRDDLLPGDIVRGIRLISFAPEIEVYQKLLDQLKKDDYREGNLDEPVETGFADIFYVFPYDWRRDNVENAHLLLKKLDAVRAKTKHPDLKFNVVAHSMGGLLTRYAAIYGKDDLSSRNKAEWKGAEYFNSISLVATPSGGSIKALDSLLNGFSFLGLGRFNLPFIQNISKFDLFTLPAIYQLLPPEGEIRIFDENLEPLALDIFDPKIWEKYGWAVYADGAFDKEFSPADQKLARAYFRTVLLRAKLFHAALRADKGQSPVPTYYLGAECKDTPDGIIVYKDGPDGPWKTRTDIESFRKSDGKRVTSAELRPLLRSPGDGVVTRRSLTAAMADGSELTIACGEHNRLIGEETISRTILDILNRRDSSAEGESR